MRSNQRWSAPSIMTSEHHFHSTVTHRNCQNLSTPWWCNSISIMMPLYAHKHHWNWKVLKHYIYVQCGCDKQSKVVYSLNHDITTSFPLKGDPEVPQSDPVMSLWQCKDALTCPLTSLNDVNTQCIGMTNMNVRSNQRWSTTSLWHQFYLSEGQMWPKSDIRPSVVGATALYAHWYHWKVLEHNMYV